MWQINFLLFSFYIFSSPVTKSSFGCEFKLQSHQNPNPKVKPHIPNSNFTFFTKLIKDSLIFYDLPRNHLKTNHSNHFQLKFVSESSGSAPSSRTKIDIENDDPTVELSNFDPVTDLESIEEWEVNFRSRPILDIRGKKMWELVVCDSSLSLKDAIVPISEDMFQQQKKE